MWKYVGSFLILCPYTTSFAFIPTTLPVRRLTFNHKQECLITWSWSDFVSSTCLGISALGDV
jgi:hypothetical protein